MKVQIDGYGECSLTDSNYVASGGEGTVYKLNNDMAVKVYHDPRKMLPTKKITELSLIKNKNVIAPIKIVKDQQGTPIGYVTKFVQDTQPMCKYFTKGYRDTIGFTDKDAVKMVTELIETVKSIHSAGALVVDLNEMNLIISNNVPYFIDVDSYQTKSFKATALMDSVKDFSATTFTEKSDWFSLAVIAFQLYIGIHPYKGAHPKYAPKEWLKRMQNNASIFDSGVKLPPSCRPLSVIPSNQLEWFKRVFKHGDRFEPPVGMGAITAQTVLFTPSNSAFTIVECPMVKKVKLPKNTMVRDGRYYTVSNILLEQPGKKLCSLLNPKIFDGVVYQDLLGRPYFAIPYEQGSIWLKEIPEIFWHRVIDVKGEDTILVVIAEKAGKYYRFVCVFDKKYTGYTCRVVETDDKIVNFTKVPNGPCVLMDGDTMEVFMDNAKVKEIPNCPLDSSMPLSNINGKVYYTDGKKNYSIKMNG